MSTIPILAVDLDPAHELLAEVAENPFEPGSLAARVAAALLTYAQYTPIVDLATLRICTQTHDEYELLDRQLKELQDAALRTETTEALLEDSRKKVSNLRAIFVRLAAVTTTRTPPDLKLLKPEKFIGERDKLREFLDQVRLNTSTIHNS